MIQKAGQEDNRVKRWDKGRERALRSHGGRGPDHLWENKTLRRQRRRGRQMEKGQYIDCKEVGTQQGPSTFNPQHKSWEVYFPHFRNEEGEAQDS